MLKLLDISEIKDSTHTRNLANKNWWTKWKKYQKLKTYQKVGTELSINDNNKCPQI